jgi:hypothetical protein
MDDVKDEGNGNGVGHESQASRARRAGERVRVMKDSALGTLSDTPGWVWAVIGGVILLMIGILAASRYRARHHDDHG